MRLLTLLAALLLAAPAFAQSTLKIVMHSDLKILDPIWASAQISRAHGYMVYDTLFGLDGDLKPQPQMVDKWSVDPAGLVYTFGLRDGLAWHDGAPVTAEDCIASLRRWGSRDVMGIKLFSYIKELSAPDPKTIRLELKQPYGLVLDSLAKPAGIVPFMMPKRVAELPATTQLKDPTGSGPFIFKADEWRPGDRVVYVKNPKYVPRAEPPANFAGGKIAKVDRIEWLSIADPQTAVNALESGEVDAVEAVAHDLLPLLEKKKGVTVVKSAYANQYALRPNWLHPPFDNPKMRLALGYAIDQTEFLKAAVGDPVFWRLCKSYFGCGTPLASDAGTQGLLEGNVAKAKELIKEAGYDGRPIVLLQVSDLASLANLGPVAKAQLERVGFAVDMRPADWQSHLARVMRKDAPPDRGWNITLSSTGVLDVVNPVTSLFLNAACEKASAGWPCDAKLEELRDAFSREPDAARRQAIADEIQVRAMQEGTHYPLGEWFGASAVSTRTSGWVRPPSATAFWNVEVKR
ncbi:MAG: ABC transporter substrate-binding protein [Rhodospirillaceae bacterium]|nr:ABC transporter substrate-binding protein [Rhodospirillaceae bacterium]